MIVQFHTSKGVIEVNSETVTDAELAKIQVTRASLDEIVRQNRDLTTEIDQLKAELAAIKTKIGME